MFRDEVITVTYVKCDICGKEKEIGKGNLNFDRRMNACLIEGFTFNAENGVYKNYCKECAIKGHTRMNTV